MWNAVTVGLLGLVAAGSWALTIGPCRDVVTKVDIDFENWPGFYFVNVMTYNMGVSCVWVNRTLKYVDGNSSNMAKENVLIEEVFSRIENGTEVTGTLEGAYVDVGQYLLKPPNPNSTIEFEVYWLYMNTPRLDCHYICSNNELFVNGRDAIVFESINPDALKENACTIKNIAKENNFDLTDLMVVNNCNCSNVPFDYDSDYHQISIQKYFSGC